MGDRPTTETLDRLYLEWSQFTGARTRREIELKRQLAEANETIEALKGRCRDMYANDDGEAWSETESYFERQGWDISLPAQQESHND